MQIKARAWVKRSKTMVDLHAITPLALAADLEQDGIFIPFSDSYEVMLWTGAKGKQCREPCLYVEWYEGDLITVPAHYEGDNWIEKYTGQIMFEDCEFYIFGKEHGNTIFDAINNYGAYRVGNIYEHYDGNTESRFSNVEPEGKR